MPYLHDPIGSTSQSLGLGPGTVAFAVTGPANANTLNFDLWPYLGLTRDRNLGTSYVLNLRVSLRSFALHFAHLLRLRPRQWWGKRDRLTTRTWCFGCYFWICPSYMSNPASIMS